MLSDKLGIEQKDLESIKTFNVKSNQRKDQNCIPRGAQQDEKH